MLIVTFLFVDVHAHHLASQGLEPRAQELRPGEHLRRDGAQVHRVGDHELAVVVQPLDVVVLSTATPTKLRSGQARKARRAAGMCWIGQGTIGTLAEFHNL